MRREISKDRNHEMTARLQHCVNELIAVLKEMHKDEVVVQVGGCYVSQRRLPHYLPLALQLAGRHPSNVVLEADPPEE